MIDVPHELIQNVSQLVSFPDVAVRINKMLEDDNSSARDIGRVIESDPALSAALLRLANSAAYNKRGPVGSIDKAVIMVGSREVRNLTFAICAAETFKAIPNQLISVEDFWKHSLYCASAARLLADSATVECTDSLFTVGLLHDIGQLVMFNQRPHQSREALHISLEENNGLTPYLSERDVFGFDHMAVGAALATEWRFPDGLREGIARHHEPFSEDEPSNIAAIIHVANSVAVFAELDTASLDDIPPLDERVMTHLGLTTEHFAHIAEASRDCVADLLSLFAG